MSASALHFQRVAAYQALVRDGARTVKVLPRERDQARAAVLRQFLARDDGPGHRLGLLAYGLWNLLDERLPPAVITKIVDCAAKAGDATVKPTANIKKNGGFRDRNLGLPRPDHEAADSVDRLERACAIEGLDREEPVGCGYLRKLTQALSGLLPAIYNTACYDVLVSKTAALHHKILGRRLAETIGKLEAVGATFYAEGLRTLAQRLGTTREREGLEPLVLVLLDLECTLATWLSRV